VDGPRTLGESTKQREGGGISVPPTKVRGLEMGEPSEGNKNLPAFKSMVVVHLFLLRLPLGFSVLKEASGSSGSNSSRRFG
jgi:hypothetical protein